MPFSSNSSSDDEENMKLFQEATDPTFLNVYTQKSDGIIAKDL